MPRKKTTGRTWEVRRPGDIAIRCDVPEDVAIAFNRLAQSASASSARLVREIVTAAAFGEGYPVNLQAILSNLRAEYDQRIRDSAAAKSEKTPVKRSVGRPRKQA